MENKIIYAVANFETGEIKHYTNYDAAMADLAQLKDAEIFKWN